MDCARSDAAAPSGSSAQRIDLRVAVGQAVCLDLPGLGTAGYRWSAECDSDAVALTWRNDPTPLAANRVGASAGETLIIHGERPGKVELRLRQARPWESPESAIDQRAVLVTVVD